MNEYDINPLVDIPTEHDSTESITLRKDAYSDNENEALRFHSGEEDINLDPPEEEAFGYLLNFKWYRKLRGLFLVSPYARIHGPVFRSQYGVYQERARHLASYPWIIHPYSTFRWCWDIVISIFLILTLIGQPILIAFYEEDLRDVQHVVISCVQGAGFFLDIILNFRTGFVSSKSDTINLDSGAIFWRYLKTWFLIDLLSTIPYDAIYIILEQRNEIDRTDAYIFKYIRILELLKIFRLVRVIRYLTRFQEAYMIDSLYVRVINLNIIIFFTLHWISCFHYLVADWCNPLDNRKENSWVTKLDLWNATVADKYVNCIIRGVSNMACLGYGSEVPRATEDILCTVFSIMVGATFFALFIGNLSSILINVDVAQKKYAEVLNQVTEYMRFKQIPADLQNRVILYYEHRYRRNFFNEINILQSLSDVLRQELQMFNCRRLVEEVPIFHGLPVAIVQNIVGRLAFEVYLPQDVIIGAHTVGDSMYFIEHGAVTVLAPNGRAVAHLRDGDFFGELALLSNERRNATVIATSYCDMYRLDKEDFEEAVMGYPEVYEQLLKFAEERAAKTTRVVAQTFGRQSPGGLGYSPYNIPSKYFTSYEVSTEDSQTSHSNDKEISSDTESDVKTGSKTGTPVNIQSATNGGGGSANNAKRGGGDKSKWQTLP